MQIALRFILFLYICCALCFNAFAQPLPFAERPVTLSVDHLTYSEVFKQISVQTGVEFSYSDFDDKKSISVFVRKRPLRTVLDEILDPVGYHYKLKGKYVILKRSSQKVQEGLLELKGYVISLRDSSRIPRASVYSRTNRRSTISNDYGYYLFTSESTGEVEISIAKEGFADTVIIVKGMNIVHQDVFIRPLPGYIKPDTHTVKIEEPVTAVDTIVPMLDSTVVENDNLLRRLEKGILSFNPNFRNISDTLFSNISFSLIPAISTNKLLSINTRNNLSFNLISGYSKGIGIMELGLGLNIDDGDVHYLQAAGIGNIVTGTFKGLQMAGLFNLNQGRTYGLQAAGVYNQTRVLSGMQVSGIMNSALKGADGWQVAGVVNLADTLRGMQISGVVNTARVVKGVQLSSVVNLAKDMRGFQLGVVNVNDSASGIPLGIFSFVRKGYHKLEVSGDDLFFARAAFRSGVNKLHNIFFVGTNWAEPSLYTYGYGFGSFWRMAKRFGINLDVTAEYIHAPRLPDNKLNLLNRFTLGPEIIISKYLRCSISPQLNFLIADIGGDNFQALKSHLPSAFIQTGSLNANSTYMWVGGQVSLKFL